jgi:hypothetical protein
MHGIAGFSAGLALVVALVAPAFAEDAGIDALRGERSFGTVTCNIHQIKENWAAGMGYSRNEFVGCRVSRKIADGDEIELNKFRRPGLGWKRQSNKSGPEKISRRHWRSGCVKHPAGPHRETGLELSRSENNVVIEATCPSGKVERVTLGRYSRQASLCSEKDRVDYAGVFGWARHDSIRCSLSY